MKYPENPGAGEWYLTTVCAKAWDHESLTKEWKTLGKQGDPPLDDNGVLWYFNHKSNDTVTGMKHYQTRHYDCVYVSITRPGDSATITLGCVDVTSKAFPEKWKEIVAAGKQRIDMLNSMDKTLGHEEIQCANCEQDAIEDDYLCSSCRAKVSDES